MFNIEFLSWAGPPTELAVTPNATNPPIKSGQKAVQRLELLRRWNLITEVANQTDPDGPGVAAASVVASDLQCERLLDGPVFLDDKVIRHPRPCPFRICLVPISDRIRVASDRISMNNNGVNSPVYPFRPTLPWKPVADMGAVGDDHGVPQNDLNPLAMAAPTASSAATIAVVRSLVRLPSSLDVFA